MFPTLLFTLALAQADLERVFHFTHVSATSDLYEVATVVRTLTEMKELHADAEAKTLTFRGTAGQGSLADWILGRLDLPAAPDVNPPPFSADVDDLERTVKVFYLKNTKAGQESQEVATVLRSVLEIRRLLTNTRLRAIAIRATDSQAEMAEWLVNRLDDQLLGPAEYRVRGASDEVVHVFATPSGTTVQQLNELASQMRSATKVRRILAYASRRAIVLRGTPAQVTRAREILQSSAANR